MLEALDGVALASPDKYHEITSRDLPRLVVLLIAPVQAHLHLPRQLMVLSGQMKLVTIPVSHDDAYSVEVLRLPRLRIFEHGKLTHNILLDTHKSDCVNTALQEAGFRC